MKNKIIIVFLTSLFLSGCEVTTSGPGLYQSPVLEPKEVIATPYYEENSGELGNSLFKAEVCNKKFDGVWYSSSEEITDEHLAEWYYNHCNDYLYDYCLIIYNDIDYDADSNLTMGVYAPSRDGVIYKDVLIEEVPVPNSDIMTYHAVYDMSFAKTYFTDDETHTIKEYK